MGTEKIICDSDVLIDYLGNKNKRHEATVHQIKNEIGLSNLLVSAVTKIEIIAGAQNKAELNRITKQIYHYNTLKINDEITDITTALIYEYNLSHGLAMPDAFIAASAIYLACPLFTYNTKDFKFIPNLKLYKY